LTLEWLVRETLRTKEALEEVLESLRDNSPQVLLAGPPGTGKTWVAERVARYLTNDAPLLVRTLGGCSRDCGRWVLSRWGPVSASVLSSHPFFDARLGSYLRFRRPDQRRNRQHQVWDPLSAM
jgi:AAA domain (dynein-related subfamily)